jgi:hypothetical protein
MARPRQPGPIAKGAFHARFPHRFARAELEREPTRMPRICWAW